MATIETAVKQETITRELIDILKFMTSDWDMDFGGEIGPQTRLVEDLYFESLDVVQLVVAIEQRFNRRDLSFEKLLMVDGHYVEDLTVSEIANFLFEQLNGLKPQ
jgi:acyl carrier protein